MIFLYLQKFVKKLDLTISFMLSGFISFRFLRSKSSYLNLISIYLVTVPYGPYSFLQGPINRF